MESKLYSKLGGLNTAVSPLSANQVDFLRLDNFLSNQKFGQLIKRGGSDAWMHSGNIWGIGGYAKQTTSLKTPIQDIPVRHRRDGGTSYIEKLDWSTNGWAALTLGANTSFGIEGVATFAQIDEFFCIAGGRPARIQNITSGPVGRLGGPAPTTAPGISLAAGVLTGQFSWHYTFRDPTTGWESSPSPATAMQSLSSQTPTLTGLETSCAREGVTQKRIYRTVSTGELPRLKVADIALAATSYADSTIDDNLGLSGPDIGDHDPPPEGVYIVAAHENRLWLLKGSTIYFSLPYDGNYANLEYFSAERTISLPFRGAGLISTVSGTLYAFCPPGFGIHEVQGHSESGFELRLVHPKEGTNYHTSLSKHGDQVAYWGASGPKVMNPSGAPDAFDLPVRNDIKEIIQAEYSDNVFVWSVWSEGLQQFVFGLAGTNLGAAQWVDANTGNTVEWEDAITGATVEWGGDTLAVTRQLIFGIDPGDTSRLAETISFQIAPDRNSESKCFTCAYVPTSRGDKINPAQEGVLLGTMNAGKTLFALRRGLTQDDGQNIVAEAITQRLDPTQIDTGESDSKRFCRIEFAGVNPLNRGLTLQYATNVDDPSSDPVTWESFDWAGSGNNRAGFPKGLARWINLRIVDATPQANRPVFDGFNLQYYRLNSREGKND